MLLCVLVAEQCVSITLLDTDANPRASTASTVVVHGRSRATLMMGRADRALRALGAIRRAVSANGWLFGVPGARL